MPCPRSAVSLARRSAIRWFSSVGVCVRASVGHGSSGCAGCRSALAARRCRVVIVAGMQSRALKRAPARLRRGAAMQRSHGVDAFGPDFQAGLQAGLDELVEVAVEHLLRVAALDAGAQVLDAALVEHVVADLAAPADVGLGRFDRVASRRCASGFPARTAWPPASSSRCRGSACWLRPVWQATTMPVGMWVMRTADSVLLTCWPPAPEER